MTSTAKQALIDQAVLDAKTKLDEAQNNYDTNLIEQPSTGLISQGIKVDIYNQITNPTPIMSTTEYTYCKTETFDAISNDWGGGDIEGCGGDFVMLHYTGFLTVPETTQYQFLNIADDGWYFTLDNKLITNDWYLKGCGGSWSESITLEAGKSYAIDAWMYEWGGGACSTLYYQTNSNWAVVPSTWYSQEAIQPPLMVKDPELLKELIRTTENYNQLLTQQSENSGTIEVLKQEIATTEQELNVAQQELEAIPPFQDPTPAPEKTSEPTKEPAKSITPKIPEPITPTPIVPEPKLELPVNILTVNPSTLTDTQVSQIISVANEILNNSNPDSKEYQQALDALFLAAQADDIQIDPSLAAIPGISAAVNAINFIGNVGADMSPKVREQAKKQVLVSVVAVGAAVQAATTMTSITTIRRIK